MRVCTLASGSSGNSTYVAGDNSAVLVDAGLSGRGLVRGLESIRVDPSELEGILITHEHLDHIRGAGVLARRYNLKVFATERTWEEIEKVIGEIPEGSRFVLDNGGKLEIEDLKIECFENSHDAVDSIGFSFHSKGVSAGIATDTGYLTGSARKLLDSSDLLIFEANHDLHMLKTGRYPWALKQRILSDRGHLSNIAAGHCLSSLISGNTRAVALAHLSRENNNPELALTTVAEILREHGLSPGKDFILETAPRCLPGKLWELE